MLGDVNYGYSRLAQHADRAALLSLRPASLLDHYPASLDPTASLSSPAPQWPVAMARDSIYAGSKARIFDPSAHTDATADHNLAATQHPCQRPHRVGAGPGRISCGDRCSLFGVPQPLMCLQPRGWRKAVKKKQRALTLSLGVSIGTVACRGQSRPGHTARRRHVLATVA
jgi:hypothetical protein